ncbi:MAG: hypothetical protein FWG62_00555 [Proteobacteria bacterium]|nr:hypothetical protein [Pseudomonadota bacterium]
MRVAGKGSVQKVLQKRNDHGEGSRQKQGAIKLIPAAPQAEYAVDLVLAKAGMVSIQEETLPMAA